MQMAWNSCGFLDVGGKGRRERHDHVKCTQGTHVTVKRSYRGENFDPGVIDRHHAVAQGDAPIRRRLHGMRFFHDSTPGQSKASSNGQMNKKTPSWSTWKEIAPDPWSLVMIRKWMVGMVKPSGLKQPHMHMPRVTWFPPLPTAWVPRSAPCGAPSRGGGGTPPHLVYQDETRPTPQPTSACNTSVGSARPLRRA